MKSFKSFVTEEDKARGKERDIVDGDYTVWGKAKTIVLDPSGLDRTGDAFDRILDAMRGIYNEWEANPDDYMVISWHRSKDAYQEIESARKSAAVLAGKQKRQEKIVTLQSEK